MPAIIPILIGTVAAAGTSAALNRRRSQQTAPAPTRVDRLRAANEANKTGTTAAPRQDTIGAPAPPDATLAASNAAGSAKLAADRQRKRGQASMLMTQPKMTGSAPRSILTPRALRGY